MPAPVPKEAQECFRALYQRLKITHLGHYLLFNIDDHTNAKGVDYLAADKAYDTQFGPVPKGGWRNFLGVIVQVSDKYVRQGDSSPKNETPRR